MRLGNSTRRSIGVRGAARIAAGAITVAGAALAAVLGSAPGEVAAASAAPRPAASARSAPAAPTRYSLVHGCYRLVSPASGTELAAGDAPYRLQATDLGQYLLYGVHGDDLADARSGATQPAPSSSTVWRIDGRSGRGFRMTNEGTGAVVPVRFAAAKGCAVYPEAEIDATGRSFTGASPTADVLGTVESHAHVTAFELFGGDWHCGRLWSPYGAPYALPASCADKEQGSNGEFETFLDFGGPNRPSEFHGWPTFKGWPSPSDLAEEGDYYTGIERAWKAGLRLMVTDSVDNEALCNAMTTRHNPCNDMASAHIQSRDLYGLQSYVDAQSGGPGKGWFRVVTDPFQARRVINEGKLAVIEGIEVSRIFGCGEMNDVPQCGREQVDAGIREVQALGVRTFFPVHEFDNAFGGSKMISGETGAVVNAGNREETGSFFQVQSCPADQQDAEQVSFPATGGLANLLNGPLADAVHGSPLPVYPPAPHCNVRGLTPLGEYLIHRMIAAHMMIQLDHSSSKTASRALQIAQDAGYSGVISAHCCNSPQLFKRIYSTGGVVTPPVSGANSFVAEWQRDRAQADPRYRFGFGWGSDMNGLAHQPGQSSDPRISYPFKSFDGRVTFTREVWGQRTFDLNTDGLANYGMYADWLNSVLSVGGPALGHDMFQGAEAYLETWERADGVPSERCRSSRGDLRAAGTRALPLGVSSTALLYRLGQPVSRPGGEYVYCVDRAPRTRLVALLDRRRRAAGYLTGARGYDADGIRPGDAVSRLGGRVSAVRGSGGRLFTGRRLRGNAHYVYEVAGGRVTAVGVVTPAARIPFLR